MCGWASTRTGFTPVLELRVDFSRLLILELSLPTTNKQMKTLKLGYTCDN